MAIWNKKHHRGDGRTLPFQVKDSAGIAVNITGAKIWFTAKVEIDTDVTDAAAAFKKATANCTGGADTQLKITIAAQGRGEIYWVKADTSSLELGKIYYDLQILLAGESDPHTLDAGQFELLYDVTRRVT